MDASQYKDYILTLLFMKYVSDKSKADPDSLIDVPEGGSFDDMMDHCKIGRRFRESVGGWLAQSRGLSPEPSHGRFIRNALHGPRQAHSRGVRQPV
jgi:hypothetical protein